MKPSKMFNGLRKFWIYIIVISLWDLSSSDEVTQRCKDKGCRVEVEDGASNDLRCNTTCRQQQGNSSKESVKMQFCMLGCQTAVDVYERDLQEKLGKLKAPDVIDRTNTSVLLSWNGKHLKNVTYLLQRRYVHKENDEWHYHPISGVRWTKTKIRVNHLHPFIAYEFRIVAKISESTLLTSPPSVPIVTKPYGAPLDPPIVTSLTCSATTIHIRWSPPFFKNGKIIAYKLTLKERNGSVPKVKSISGTNVTILTMLRPNTEYEVRIAAWNRYGLGHETRNFVSTLPNEESSGVTPYLVLGSNHSLRQKNLDETHSVRSAVIYNDSFSDFVDVAIHYYKNFIFFTNKSGEVYRLSRTTANSLISIYRSSKHPGPLSVDWLHDRIYIAEDRAIISCNLDGSSCSVVLDNLPSRPSHIVADPFNGYLFWSHKDPAGIYKIDLASLGTSIYDLRRYAIAPTLGLAFHTFTLDFSNYRLYYPNNTGEALLSVNLDGSDKTNVRPEGTVQKAQFLNITSLSIYEGEFYWTNGSKVWFEEYDARSELYHHNTLYIFDYPFTGFNVWHPSAQPIPVPLQKPRHVQAVFSSRSTTLQWSRPDWDQGRGAWQDWFYEIEAKDLTESTVKKIDNVTMRHQQLHLRINDLQPETPYSFRVRAYTSAGHGPWSEPFSGETLKDDGSHPHLLYSCSGYIYQVGLDGAGYKNSLELDPRHGIKQLVVINGWYLWLNREYKLYIKRGLSDPHWLANIDDALVISYDWLGEKLYWWNSRNQISRSSLNGRDVENVYQGFSQAHHLCIDSVEGYMYWATANAVEVAHLNNADHREIARLPQFDFHILGLTLDLDQRFLYWLVKENQKTLVYRSPLLSQYQLVPGRVVKMAELENPAPPSIQGMYYYSNRLFWLSSDGSVVVMDTKEAHNVAKLELPSGSKIESLTLVKPIQGLPSEAENTTVGGSLLVIPDPVQPSSVNVSGPWNAFNITWQPTPVKHGQVFYQLLLTFGPNKEQISERTYSPYLLVTNVSGIRPFMRVQLSMKSCTYWGCSHISTRDLVTPMSAPSPPRNPRGFVSYRRSPLRFEFTIEVELHWSPPEYSNGRLGNYTINYLQSDGTWKVTSVGPNTTFYRRENATKNFVYRFRASTCNEVGCSRQSDEVLVDTSKENPVPQLITATDSSIHLFLPDAQTSAELWNRSSAALTFEAQERALYLLDKNSHIVKLVEVKGHEIVGVSGRGKSIAMDWVGRDLYWLEEEPQGYCEIRTYNIDRGDTTSNRVLQMDMSGSNLAVHPYESAIFWSVTDNDGSGRIMRSYMNGNHKETVIGRYGPNQNGPYSRHRRAAPNCNCPALSVSSVFAMDHSRTENGEIYIVEKSSGSIWASDLTGCLCRLVVNATNRGELGLPPDSIAIDHQRVYWSNTRQATLHSVLKETGSDHFSEPMGGVKQIMAIGRHLQPFPDPKCLRMDNYHEPPRRKSQTNTTLTLTLGVWRPHPDCANISLPRTRYSVHYRNATNTRDTTSCLEVGSVCKNKITYDTEVTLTGLDPHKYYFMEVVADNFYTRHERQQVKGAHAIFITAPGVPSEPRDVKAEAQTPESIAVTWRAPAVTNGKLKNVEFEVQWWKSQTTTEIYRSIAFAPAEQYAKGSFIYTPRGLKPETSYDFKIIAFYGEDRGMGESRSKTSTGTTFPTPSLVELVNATPQSINVSWRSPLQHIINKHRIVIAPVNEPERKNASKEYLTSTGQFYNETFKGLEPNTEYALFINATYKVDTYFLWPPDSSDRNIVKTLPGPPRRPKAPVVETLHNDQPRITWTPPNDGGKPIDEYRLMARRNRPNEMNWTLVYNGSEIHWLIVDLEVDVDYVFAVTAHNVKGWSDWSPESEPTTYSFTSPVVQGTPDQLTVILAVSFAVIFLAVLSFAAIMFGSRVLKKHKPVPVDFVNPSPRADVELAILRDLPRNTRQHTNALYAINIVPTEEDVAALPHFRRDCLVLTKFLGSGAFGEVFEGVAKDILGPETGDTRVAVKTLRKGASGVEKEEFLKEALLMDNFTHTHILHLLGVCLQNDPQFIILELMEGGDLLSYLRNARPTTNRPPRLTMADMVSICTDVAKGCKYLEDMHFVHRDLAARNCLVSSIDPARRVVKIGDFGLARDIYKNDYYRKEGEGLLPVRWMSPESLIDGVFTTYSDVWAFGVLVWEVLTLGQQPYPARTNIEVLNYVRGGGRLDRPDHCPEDLNNVMLKCWCFSPGGRPSFSYLLSELESIKLPGIEASNHYTTTDPLEKSNQAEPVVYSTVSCDSPTKPIEYTELSRNMQGNPGPRQTDSAYVGPPAPHNRQGQGSGLNRAPSSSIARPRPVARPDHSPYLQPVSHTGGPNKYLELVADDDVTGAARSNSSRSNHCHDVAGQIPTSGLHYAQLTGMCGVSLGSNSDFNDCRVESPDIHSRDPKCQGHATKKDSAIDYAQLAISDEADNALDTDSEEVGSEHVSHGTNARGQRIPSGNHRNPSNPSRAGGWPHRQNTHYAQIASTDSDTDSEIFDRSRSQSHSRDVSLDSSTAVAPGGGTGSCNAGAASCDDISSKNRHGWSPARDIQSQASNDGLAPYTIDGYLAPRSLRISNKNGVSSSSINSNNTSSGQSSC